MNESNDKKKYPEIVIESLGPLSPHDEALFEAGKEMLKTSINTSRDFCKYMITISTGAIPIYLGLLNLVLPDFSKFGFNQILLFIPPFIFLLCEIIFILGYFPQVDYFSLDIIEELKNSYETTITKRKMYTNVGIGVFLLGNILSIMAIIFTMIS